MDRLNNNENSNSFETNFDSFNITCDDVRNHNESRTTARITPLTVSNKTFHWVFIENNQF